MVMVGADLAAMPASVGSPRCAKELCRPASGTTRYERSARRAVAQAHRHSAARAAGRPRATSNGARDRPSGRRRRPRSTSAPPLAPFVRR